MIDKNSWIWLLKPWLIVLCITLLPVWIRLAGFFTTWPTVCIVLSCVVVLLITAGITFGLDTSDRNSIDILRSKFRFERDHTKYKYKIFCVEMKSDNVLYIPAVKLFYGDGYAFILQKHDYKNEDINELITYSKREALKNACCKTYAEANKCIDQMKKDRAAIHRRNVANNNAVTVNKVIEVKIK
jgi:hypothetical protein